MRVGVAEGAESGGKTEVPGEMDTDELEVVAVGAQVREWAEAPEMAGGAPAATSSSRSPVLKRSSGTISSTTPGLK